MLYNFYFVVISIGIIVYSNLRINWINVMIDEG